MYSPELLAAYQSSFMHLVCRRCCLVIANTVLAGLRGTRLLAIRIFQKKHFMSQEKMVESYMWNKVPPAALIPKKLAIGNTG